MAAIDRLDLIDPELREAYMAFSENFVVTHETLSAIRAGGGMAKAVQLPVDVEMTEIKQDGVTGILYRPIMPQGTIRSSTVSAVVWFHGGGFVFGQPSIHQALYIEMVQKLGIVVFAPAYRLAPEHPFPAAHEDAVKAWLWFNQAAPTLFHVDASRIALGGTSAGGGLAFSTALRCRDDDQVMPAALVGNIPFFSADFGGSCAQVALEKCWGERNNRGAFSMYTPDGAADSKGYAWVHSAKSFEGFPPTQVGAAELDTLRDGAIDVAVRLMQQSRNGCELHVWKGAYHGSVALAPHAEVSKCQDAAIVSFLRRQLQSPTSDTKSGA